MTEFTHTFAIGPAEARCMTPELMHWTLEREYGRMEREAQDRGLEIDAMYRVDVQVDYPFDDPGMARVRMTTMAWAVGDG